LQTFLSIEYTLKEPFLRLLFPVLLRLVPEFLAERHDVFPEGLLFPYRFGVDLKQLLFKV
jgi:hypothetical protein